MSVALIEEPNVRGYAERVLLQPEVEEKLTRQRVFCCVPLHITPTRCVRCTSTAIARKKQECQGFQRAPQHETPRRFRKSASPCTIQDARPSWLASRCWSHRFLVRDSGARRVTRKRPD